MVWLHPLQGLLPLKAKEEQPLLYHRQALPSCPCYCSLACPVTSAFALLQPRLVHPVTLAGLTVSLTP